MGRKYYNYPRGSRPQLAAERIYGGKPREKTVGLGFSPKEGVRFAISVLAAAYESKSFEITVYRTPRRDGKFKVKVTAGH